MTLARSDPNTQRAKSLGFVGRGAKASGAIVRREILLALGAAFFVHYLARIKKGSKPDYSTANRESNIVAWLAVLFMLSIASDFQTTQQLAVAFAFLVALVALIGEGANAFANISYLVSYYSGQQRTFFDKRKGA